jgi:hypothetical protein
VSTYDLGIWQTKGSLTAGEASHVYASFCRGENPPHAVRHSAAVAAFYHDLTSQWPDLAPRQRKHTGESIGSPWAAPLNLADNSVLLSCNWSDAETVCAFVDRLANLHGLVLFDPQAEEVYLPDAR